ncbi:DUF2683 family protein [Candidatus Woesearchaeota archaeon]|nr:DUF2683 family protein [Candidatus Woesearchaeota archaeon]
MVKAIIDIKDHTNHVLNIVKAKYNLKDKSAAIDIMAKQYEDEVLEPELRPEYVEKAKKIMKQKPIPVGTVDNIRKRLNIK